MELGLGLEEVEECRREHRDGNELKDLGLRLELRLELELGLSLV